MKRRVLRGAFGLGDDRRALEVRMLGKPFRRYEAFVESRNRGVGYVAEDGEYPDRFVSQGRCFTLEGAERRCRRRIARA